MAQEVRSKILDTIKNEKYFSVILDCTPDISHEEQMSLVIRCLDLEAKPIQVKEFFIEFLVVDETTGHELFNVLIEVIEDLKLNFGDIRGKDMIMVPI